MVYKEGMVVVWVLLEREQGRDRYEDREWRRDRVEEKGSERMGDGVCIGVEGVMLYE